MLINSKDIKVLLNLTIIGIVIFLAHYGLYQLFPYSLYAHNVFNIHPFLLLITLGAVVAVKIIFRKVRDNIIGYVFLFSSLIKMFASIFFLLPTIRQASLFRTEYILQFFIIYFIYLAAEVYYLVKHFKSQKG